MPARTTYRPLGASIGAALLLLSPAGALEARAAAPASSAIVVERPWTRATPGSSSVAAGYLTIRNTGDLADRLVSVSTEVAGRAGPHTMTTVNGVMAMRPMTGGLVVPAHGNVTLAPGGDHLMFEALKHPLREGNRFAATLVFERAGPVSVTFTVESIGARAPGGSDGVPAKPGAAPMTMD